MVAWAVRGSNHSCNLACGLCLHGKHLFCHALSFQPIGESSERRYEKHGVTEFDYACGGGTMQRAVILTLGAALVVVLPIWPFDQTWTVGPAIAVTFLLSLNILI